MSELKPCPFCGNTPEISGRLGRFTLFHQCMAVKTNIGVGGKSAITEKWNTRTSHDRLTEQNKMLREALVEVVSADSFHYQDDAEFAEAINSAKETLEDTK